jgi:uncharacterized protein
MLFINAEYPFWGGCQVMSFISKIFGTQDIDDASSMDALKENSICDAAREGNESAVKKLLEKGDNVNITGGGTLDFSPLMWASEEGNVEMLTLLLDKGANPNLTNKRGMCALLLAAKNGHIDVVRLLLDRGSDISFETEGVSPLHAAVAYEHPDIVRLLLEKGARDDSGLALESAKQINNSEIMNLLTKSKS